MPPPAESGRRWRPGTQGTIEPKINCGKLENLLEMVVSRGKSPINSVSSIAMFDYRRLTLKEKMGGIWKYDRKLWGDSELFGHWSETNIHKLLSSGWEVLTSMNDLHISFSDL